MKHLMYGLCIIVALIAVAVLHLGFVQAYTSGQEASVAVGQSSLTGGSRDQGGIAGANTLDYPYGAATDGTRLVVSDYYNNRVLIYNSIPTSHNAAADIVLGQANFTSTSANRGGAVAADTLYGPANVTFAGNKLIVVDYSNCRVLIWNSLPTSNGQAADVVVGQNGMSTSTCGVSSTALNYPWGVSYDSESNKLLIADYYNSRVLIYNSIPTSNGQAADVVVGQQNMTSNGDNQGGSTAANTLSYPYNARIIEEKLVVADYYNSRVLIFNTVPTTNNASADVVLGQANMSGGDTNRGGSVAANTLSYPADILYDGDNFFVADSNNNRVLMWNDIPTSNGQVPNEVLGQSTFTSGSYGTTSTTLRAPSSLDSTEECGMLLVGDTSNHRVLTFTNDTSCPDPTATPTPTLTPTPTGTSTPTSIPAPTATSAPEKPKPQIAIDEIQTSGGTFTPIADSSTGDQEIVVVIEPQTFNFNAFVSSKTTESDSLVRSSLSEQAARTQLPANITLAGDFIGLKTQSGISWQVGKVQEIWYKAYTPDFSTDGAARIIPELQTKPSLVSLSYTDADLIPPGQPHTKFRSQQLKIAHSFDGVQWTILRNSSVDPVNRKVTVSAKLGGYYMLIADAAPVSQSRQTTVSEPRLRPTSAQKLPQPTVFRPSPTIAVEVRGATTLRQDNTPLWKKIVNFILR